jgi:hypothetical protein
MKRTLTFSMLVLCCLLAGPLQLASQDGGGQQGTDPENDELIRERDRAKLEKEIAEARLAALMAMLPTSDTTGPEGSVSVSDGGGYFAEIISFETLGQAAAIIAEKVGAGGGKKIVVSDQLELSEDMQLWRLIDSRLEFFETLFERLLTGSQAFNDRTSAGIEDPQQTAILSAGAAAIPALLSGIADIAAFFKVDRQLIGREVAPSDRALLAELARVLKGKGWQPFLPSLYLGEETALLTHLEKARLQRIEVASRHGAIKSRFQPDLDELAAKRKRLTAVEAELAKLRSASRPDGAAIAKLEREVQQLREAMRPLEKKASLLASFETVIEAFDDYDEALTTSAAGAVSPIESLHLVDVIKNQTGAVILFVDVLSQGAEIHVSKGAWRTRLSYVGGGVCAYFLVNLDGVYLGSGTVPVSKGESFRAKHIKDKASYATPTPTPTPP